MSILNRNKSFKVYKDIGLIPTGKSGTRITDGCLVLEGGAWRGLYTQGVIDRLLKSDINFHTVVGVSAGALSGVGYMAGEIGWAARINLSYRQDPNYVGVNALVHDHGITGFSFLFNEMLKYYPLDTDRICDPRRRFVSVATNCVTGRAEYMSSHDFEKIKLAVQASATVPYVSDPVWIDSMPYLDGGCADCVPFRWAEEEGYRKIIVVRTRHRLYRDDIRSHTRIDRLMYREYPNLMEDLITSSRRYNEMLDELDRQEKEGRVFVIAPAQPITIRRFEGDMDKLGELYWRGWHDMETELPRLGEYLRQAAG